MNSTVAGGITLLLYLALGILGIGHRSLQHRRQTGSGGFEGISGRPGSLPWLAGVGFVTALVVCVVAPALQAFGVLRPIGALTATWIQVAGLVIAVAGLGGMLYAQHDMGRSWRIGVDPAQTTDLVLTGTFALVRNPIYTTLLIFAAGAALLAPTVVAVAGFVLLLLALQVHVRAVEEPYLRTVHGDSYRSYTATVGRFVPYLGRV